MIWLAFAMGVFLTGFGATAGAALLAVSRRQLAHTLASRLRGGGVSLGWLAEVDVRLGAASATTSLGVVLLAGSLPAVFVGSALSRSSIALALVALPLALVLGYLVPRWLTEPRAEAVAEALRPIFNPWSRVIAILLPIRPPSRQRDLGRVWHGGAAAGAGTDEELAMIGGVMMFTQRDVRDVMTPRTEIIAVAEDAPLADIAAAFAHSGYSRLPVYRNSLDDIAGMLHAFDLFKLRPGDSLPIRPVAVAPATRSCGDVLLDMQRERRHLAIVIDEFGGTLGIVTLEDLLEELVGEIFDEHDGEPPTAEPAGTAIVEVDGAEPADMLAERFGVSLARARSATVGGLVAELAGRIPLAGERFLIAGLEIDVLQASPARVDRVLVRRGPVTAVPLEPAP